MREGFGCERGEVYFLNEGNAYGSELMSGRPVVVISGKEHLESLPTAVVACLSRTVRNWISVVPVNTDSGSSNVICNQIKTVDKGRLTKFMCKLTDEEMAEVDEALRYVMDLGTQEVVVEKEVVKETVDNSDLEVELSMYKKLYEKAIEKLAALRFEKDTTVVAEQPKVDPLEIEREQNLKMLEQLEKTVLVQPEKKKRGRPPKEKKETVVVAASVPCSARRDEIAKYANPSGKTNINTDPWYVIGATTGMKLTTAQAIASHRNKFGEYSSLVELLDVPGFGSMMLNKYGRMLEV